MENSAALALRGKRHGWF